MNPVKISKISQNTNLQISQVKLTPDVRRNWTRHTHIPQYPETGTETLVSNPQIKSSFTGKHIQVFDDFARYIRKGVYPGHITNHPENEY